MRKIGVRPVPFLIAEALASISAAPPRRRRPAQPDRGQPVRLGFNDFLANLAPIIVVMLIAFVALSRFLFRKDFTADPEQVAQVMQLDEREAIQDRSLLIRSLIVLALVLAAFTLHGVLHLEPSVVALLGAGLLVGISGLRPQTYLVDIEWETLLFFAGLFILVGSLVKTGVIDQLAAGLNAATGDSVPTAMMLILWGSAVISAVVDNIPFVATMTPVVDQLVSGNGPFAGQNGLWWAWFSGGPR